MFDTYKADSLKSATREKRRQGSDPIFIIRSEMILASKEIPMSRFHSHDKTDLTEYLTGRTLEYNEKLVQGGHHIGLRTWEKQQ